ncbi:hypothetical protein SK128_009259 [Halocaridina rubra]|uniref:Uncharacterized protein n=1 Tax=Halocaridina rubra TaxID=373956 RepID=A0AAN8XHC1_HALRR
MQENITTEPRPSFQEATGLNKRSRRTVLVLFSTLTIFFLMMGIILSLTLRGVEILYLIYLGIAALFFIPVSIVCWVSWRRYRTVMCRYRHRVELQRHPIIPLQTASNEFIYPIATCVVEENLDHTNAFHSIQPTVTDIPRMHSASNYIDSPPPYYETTHGRSTPFPQPQAGHMGSYPVKGDFGPYSPSAGPPRNLRYSPHREISSGYPATAPFV